MARVKTYLGYFVVPAVCAALASCNSDEGPATLEKGHAAGGDAPTSPAGRVVDATAKLVFSRMYSAYDGVHDYRVPVAFDQALFEEPTTVSDCAADVQGKKLTGVECVCHLLATHAGPSDLRDPVLENS